MPQSERRVDNNTLEIIVTLDDPKTFTQSWDTRVTCKAGAPGMKFIELICENNRSSEH